MASNHNSNIVSNGNIHTYEGIECVKWNADSFAHENFTAEQFEALSGNNISFFEEWATNRYPLLCNGWLLEVVGAHIQDEGRVFAVTFIVNNAVVPDLANTYGVMTLASQNGGVTCEIVNMGI